jgi:hypothetical protein
MPAKHVNAMLDGKSRTALCTRTVRTSDVQNARVAGQANNA